MKRAIEQNRPERRVIARVERLYEDTDFFYLGVKRENYIFGFDDVLCQIVPRVPGGDENDVYDMLINQRLVSETDNLVEAVKKAMVSTNLCIGEIHVLSHMEPFTDYITGVNGAYHLPTCLFESKQY